VLLAAGFALAHTQSPLFFSNQNQYLLHGLAQAGYGHLDHDWLANTKDPTPAFSFLVKWLYKLGGLVAIQAAYFVLLMYYFAMMWRLVKSFSSPPIVPFAAIFTAAHAAIFRLMSVQINGIDYPWYFQAGLAGQYLLGPGLQPSAFGVLLIGSLAEFSRGRPIRAALLAALAADIHATYLLPAALLVLGYAITSGREKTRSAVIAVMVALAAVAPMLWYILFVLQDGGMKSNDAAVYILAQVRIPHHTQISRWLDWIAGLQIAWMLLGLILVRKTALFRTLLLLAGGGLLLTLPLVFRDNDQLALVFPWRVSVLLVPIATAAVAARLAEHDRDNRVVAGLAFVVFLVQGAGGVLVMALGLGYQMNEFELPMLQHVRDQGGPNDVYLIPTKLPAPTSKRGIESFTFTPPPRPGSQGIPVDLQRFRLASGTPIYVDFKSMPYATSDVHEWQRRMTQVEKWYETKDWDRLELREELIKEGITHVVAPRSQTVIAEFLEREYADNAYAVYRVK